MAVIATASPSGYVLSCTGGTAIAAATTAQISKDTALRVIGIICSGSAAGDITRIYDGSMNAVFIGSAAATAVASITFPSPVTIYGLCAGMSGGTSCWASLLLE